MRCPNCGNENPDDYTFCDECGAKLTPPGSEASASGPAQEAVYAPSVDSGDDAASPSLDAAQDASNVAVASKPEGGVCPNCGATTVPGEAYCNECGAELATAAPAPAPAGDGAPSNMEPYMGSTEGNGESGGVSVGVPVTEDTMPSAAQPDAQDAPQAEAAEAASMPGVMPIEEREDAIAPSVPAMDEPPPASATSQPAGAGPAAWANDALRQLEEAQQSMAKGDWTAYGQSMSALKVFLENVIKGIAPQVAGMDVTSAPVAPQPVVDQETAAASSVGISAMPASAPPPPPLPTAPVTASAPAAIAYQGTSTAAGLARLVVIATGAEMPLPQQEEITVGREDPSSGIFPDIDLTPYGGEDGGVSRRHARLLHIGGDYFVEDLQSTNYTKLDGQRLPARVREKLEDGARLDFGRVAMIFRKG